MRARSVVLVLFLLMALPVFSSVITFDGPAAGVGPNPYFLGSTKGAIVANQFGPAVTFTTANGAVDYASSQFYIGSGPSTGNFLAVNTVPFPSAPGTGTLTITFDGWVVASATPISFFLADNDWNAGSTSVVTKDLSGTTIQSWTLGQFSDTHTFSTGNVHSIVFTDIGGYGFVLDTIDYGTINHIDYGTINHIDYGTPDSIIQAVPEPGTLGLLGAGLAAMGLLFRRRRAS